MDAMLLRIIEKNFTTDFNNKYFLLGVAKGLTYICIWFACFFGPMLLVDLLGYTNYFSKN
jgi:hypothetical protein